MGETEAKLWRRWTDPVRWLIAAGGLIVLLGSTLSSLAWARVSDTEARLRTAEAILQRQDERDTAILQRLDRDSAARDRAADAILERLDRIEARLSRNP